jgi:hypothetical protein
MTERIEKGRGCIGEKEQVTFIELIALKQRRTWLEKALEQLRIIKRKRKEMSLKVKKMTG